ncbi:MAG: ABC transporter substrate-binding protein [Proteobacteria bacterium]|nr:ABC transporter substrate-binding protein [Pseudomonadota bacterium]
MPRACGPGVTTRWIWLVALFAQACEANPERLHRRRDPGALVVAQATGAISLEPVRVTDNESIEAGTLLYEGLVHWKPGTTDIEPGLATAWKTSPDGRTWTFTLRDHVVFHDGTACDAAAVVFSFERVIDPKHPQYIAGPIDGTYWRLLFKDVTRIVAIDAATVQIETARPYAPLLGELAMFPIVSPTAVATWGAAYRAHPVGTGPFAFESWVIGEQLVVHRNPTYWGKAPALERIVFRVVVDARQRLIDLESGSVDVATAILPDEQTFVELHPDLRLHHVASNDVSYLAFNTQHPPFDDPLVRRAASHVINKEPIVKLAYQGRATAADGPLPPTQWGYHAPDVKYAYDVALARKLLAQSKTFDPARVYRLYAPTTPRPYLAQPERVARSLAAALEEVGIHIELVLQPYKEHRLAVERGDHDLAVFGWIGDTGDPDNFLYVLFHSDNAVVGEAQNIAFYRDPGVDALLRQAQEVTDQATRSGLYAAVQDRIGLAAPWVPIAHSEVVVAARRSLAGVVLSPLGHPIYALMSRTEGR